MDCKTTKANAFMCSVYSEKLIQTGIPADVAAVIAATKYAPAEVEGLAQMFAMEQATIAEELAKFNKVVTGDSPQS